MLIFGYLEVPVAGHQVSDTIDPQEFVLRPVVPRRRKTFYPLIKTDGDIKLCANVGSVYGAPVVVASSRTLLFLFCIAVSFRHYQFNKVFRKHLKKVFIGLGLYR